MNYELLAQVTKIEAREEYQKKANSNETDYSLPKKEVVYSTLEILDNGQDISGEIKLKRFLEFGTIHRIILPDESPIKVVVDKEARSGREAGDKNA